MKLMTRTKASLIMIFNYITKKLSHTLLLFTLLTDDVFIKHIKGPLFFGSTSDFQQLALQIPDTASTVIIRMGRMQYMDQSGLYAMEDVLRDLTIKGVRILLVNVLNQPRYMMERIDIIPDLVPEEQIFSNFPKCLKGINTNINN